MAEIRDGVLSGQTLRGDFASMMYWREEGFPQAGAINGFGSAVVRSLEGHLLFGRMAAHTASPGQVYPFAGSLDDHDVKHGIVDLEGSITRELLEETGLKAADAVRVPGLIAVREGPRLSLAAEFRFAVPSGELRQRIEAFLETDPDPELESIIIFRRAAFVAHHRMPPYARLLVDHLMKEQAA
jgi:8-oxo-dGTP pyrophosphatase MutT (NUDIX family)